MDWSTLPKELLSTIFSFSNCEDLISAVCVNSSWNSIANYDYVWKEAIFNSSFPHPHLYSQKDVPWRQIVKRHFQTKRNIVNRRCVQHTLGTRCQTSDKNTEITLSSPTASGAYCILNWETIESRGYSYTHHEHVATELWDLEKRTIVNNYDEPSLELSNKFIIKEKERAFNEHSFYLLYSKFDPAQPLHLNTLEVPDTKNFSFMRILQNEDENSSLIALHASDWSTQRKLIQVFDLRTGNKILEKIFWTKEANYASYKFYGNKFAIQCSEDQGGPQPIIIVDVIADKTIEITESGVSCIALTGNELWIASSKKNRIVKYNLTTMARHEYSIEISDALEMKIYDGIIYLFVRGVKLTLIEVTSTKCRVLGELNLSWSVPQLHQLPNGALTLLCSSYAHILSFRDEDVELPIQVLKIETTGKSQAIDIKQGDLNKKIAEQCSFSLHIKSQIVFENDTNRYYVVYSCLNEGNHSNDYVDKVKRWGCTVEGHKTAVFQLVQFDAAPPKRMARERSSSTAVAFGPCWIVYEAKVNGGWQRAAPHDDWLFFKIKLGLK